ncbi:MAG: nitroreductase family protein [Oscillospiraceae bacterium]|nr:nitroreductase family protein [Oscillospiraceae bacterium]
MNVYEAIQKRRAIRKFERKDIDHNDLVKLIECARVAAYGANMQPLKFAIIEDKVMLDKIFPCTKWAAYLPEGTPAENERPAAYIAVLGDKSIKASGLFEVDAGSAVATMMLEAVELGLGSCWLGAIDKESIKRLLGLDENLTVLYLLALGYPAQESRVCDMNGDIKYFEDENKVINVPKRSLDDIIVKL